jgi:hypothetical protein
MQTHKATSISFCGIETRSKKAITLVLYLKTRKFEVTRQSESRMAFASPSLDLTGRWYAGSLSKDTGVIYFFPAHKLAFLAQVDFRNITPLLVHSFTDTFLVSCSLPISANWRCYHCYEPYDPKTADFCRKCTKQPGYDTTFGDFRSIFLLLPASRLQTGLRQRLHTAYALDVIIIHGQSK